MTIQEIKSNLPITQVLSHYNLHPNQNGMLSCPFHSDKKPSMKIYLETNTVYCFAGSCKVESLDVIDFIMQMDGISKHEAILKAKSLISFDTTKITSPMKSSKPKNADSQLLTEVFEYFKKGLKHSRAKTAKSYKASRGLNGVLEMGYNSGKFHQNKSEEIVSRLLNAGLLKPSERGYTIWANGCLIFALRNQLEEIVGFYGRSTGDDFSSNSDGHFYLTNRKGLYPGYPDKKVKRLILTESVIDAASLLQMKSVMEEYEVLALYGTQGLTTEHRQAILQSLDLEEIIFALDGDEAGRRWTEKQTAALRVLYPKLKYTTLELPEDEDINSLCVGHEENESLINHLLENRIEVGSAKTSKKITAVERVEQVDEDLVPKVQLSNNLITSDKHLYQYQYTPDLLIQVMGGIKFAGLDRLRATLKLDYTKKGNHRSKMYRDSLDLYSGMQVEKFVKRGSSRLEMSSKLLQESIDDLTTQLERYRQKQLESIDVEKIKKKQLTSEEKRIGEEYLSAKDLMERTSEDIGKSGVIGEELNRLIMFLVYVSRKMSKPMHVIIFGSSGSGKTHLQSSVAALIPEEDKLETTTLSDNAVYYFEENELSHLLIMIEDMDGAEGVLLPLRELQSKQEIRKTVTLKGKDGKMKTVTLIVRGPISLSGCTTKERLYEDNANRSLLLYVDESDGQDDRIMEYQRQQSSGQINEVEQKQLRNQFQNMQRLLKPIKVVNPYADYIRIPKEVFKPRRTNSHVLKFIEAVTFYHQYQREVKLHPVTRQRYIETTIEDIEWAFKLLGSVLLRKSDELSGGCRKFYELLKDWLKSESRTTFYQKEIRNLLRMNPSNVKYYLGELMRYDLLKKVGGNRYNGGYEYEVKKMEDYTELQAKIDTSLAEILSKIKSK